MKDFIRDRLRLLLEHKKTTHTGGNKRTPGGKGDNVYYLQHGTKGDFKTHYNEYKTEVFNELENDNLYLQRLFYSTDPDIKYGTFSFRVSVNSKGGPKIQGVESPVKRQSSGCFKTKNMLMCNVSAPLRFKENLLGKIIKLKLNSGKSLVFQIVARFGDDKIFFTICNNENILSIFSKNNIFVTDLASLMGSSEIKTKYTHIKNVSDFKNYSKKIDEWKPYTFKLSKGATIHGDDGTYTCNLTDVIKEFEGLPIPFIPIRNYLNNKNWSPSPHYYAYLNLLYSEYKNIEDFIDGSVGYLDDKAKAISKEKTPEKFDYKHDKLKDEIKNKEKRMGTVMKMKVDEKEIRAEIADITAKKIKAVISARSLKGSLEKVEDDKKDEIIKKIAMYNKTARQMGEIQKQLEKKLKYL